MMSACPACWAVSCRMCRSTSRADQAVSGGYQGASGSLCDASRSGSAAITSSVRFAAAA